MGKTDWLIRSTMVVHSAITEGSRFESWRMSQITPPWQTGKPGCGGQFNVCSSYNWPVPLTFNQNDVGSSPTGHTKNTASLAKLDTAPGSYPDDSGFESLAMHQV